MIMTTQDNPYGSISIPWNDGVPEQFRTVDCGKGWVFIIKNLMKVINENPEARVLQIKSKFGGLRVYVHNTTSSIEAAISRAEAKAWNTCEKCGSTESVRRNNVGWITTLCSTCIGNIEDVPSI